MQTPMPDVAFSIEVMIETYCQESGRKPVGIALGPAEYRDLCNRVKQSKEYLRDADPGLGLITDYKGLPIVVKELPGIDLLINPQEAFHAAYR